MASNIKRTYDFAFNNCPLSTPQTDDHDEQPLQAIPINCYNANDIPMTIDLKDRGNVDGVERGQPQEQQPNANANGDDESELLLKLHDHIKTKFGYKDVTDLKIVYERKLTMTDAKGQQARLAIVKSDLKKPFLTQSEDLVISWRDYSKPKGNLRIPVKVIVGPSEYQMSITRWNYHDNKTKKLDDNNNDIYSSSPNKKAKTSRTNNNNKGEKQRIKWKYVLNKEWNDVMKQNHLKQGDKIRVASFRSKDYIHLAIVKQSTMKLFGNKIEQYQVEWPRNWLPGLELFRA